MSSTGYSVTSETLDKEAADWSHEAIQLHSVASLAAALKFDRINSGLFQGITTGNDQVVDAITDRALEGCDEMHRIADTLRQTAQNYQNHEAETSAAFSSLDHR